MKYINKIIRNNQVFQYRDESAQTSIDNIAKALDELEIPSKVSELDNDSGFITNNDVDGKFVHLSGDTMTGHLVLGDGNTTGFKKVEAIRNINTVPNGAAFYVNSDGTAAFFHKTYGSTGLTGAVNDAILRFNNEGLYFAKGETSRTSATDFKKVLTEDDAYNKQESDDKYALKSDVEELQLYKFPNATIFGTPTIQNGQVSNFSNDNYLQFPFLVDFQNRPFNIYFSFTTPSVMSGQENILDSNNGLAFAIREGRVVAVASDNGTSWTTGELISDETLTPNTTYYFKIYWDNNIFGYSGGLSKDDYSISKETNMLNTPYPKTMLIGRSFVNGGNHYNGSINLNDAYLEISNKVVWEGMDDVGLATRAAIDLSNIDAKGVEVIETIVDNKITTKQDILVSGTNIKTINNQSILGSGNITIQGGEGGGTQVIEISSTDYNALTDEQKNDPTILYVISDAESEYYKKNEVYNKTEVYNKEESDAKYSLKGEGKTYNSGRNIVIDDNNNINAYNVLTSIGYENNTYNTSLIYYRYGNTGSYISSEGLRFPKLRINGSLTSIANNSSTLTNSIDLDSVYAKSSDIPDVSTKQDTLVSGTNIKTINGQSILGSGNITIQGGGGGSVVNLTQAEYNALSVKDPNTIYNITDAEDIDVYTKDECDNKFALKTDTPTFIYDPSTKTLDIITL